MCILFYFIAAKGKPIIHAVLSYQADSIFLLIFLIIKMLMLVIDF